MEKSKSVGLLRRTASFVVTMGVVGAAGAAVVFGSQFLADRAEAAPSPSPAELAKVAVERLALDQSYTTSRQFLGQVEADAEAAISFELGGRLAELTLEEGDAVEEGQIIARLDTALLEAEEARLTASRSALSAQLDFAETRLARAIALQSDGFSSQETRDQALATRDELQARIAEVDAGLMTVKINLEKSVVQAPFSGRVGTLTAEISETLSAGQPVLTLIETTDPLVRVGLPLDLSPDVLAQAYVEISGVRQSATLRQLRPDIDPVTRTRTALFEIDGAAELTFGQTVTLKIDSEVTTQGTWVPVDALQQGSGSVWTVLVVEDGIVRTAGVELLHSESDRAFVRGSFADGALLIQTGAHRVVPGQKVELLDAEG